MLELDTSPRKTTKSKPKTYWFCKCDCGKIVSVTADRLRRGETKSCGCFQRKRTSETSKTHGMSRFPDGTIRPEYNAWIGMKQRCYNKNNRAYDRYGGRGIGVCDRWLDSFENFFEDMGFRPSPKYSIDRIDVNGDYEPSNCRWATNETQSRNQRLSKTNSTGVRGVSYSRTENRFIAGIHVNGKHKYLGKFKNLEEAKKVRKQAEEKYWK